MSVESQSSNKRIAKNTMMLYIRMVFVLLVNLYVSRVVLKALGVEDYGLYSVVGSVVTFLGFLNTSMAAASQRFLAYAKGKGNEENLSSTFNSIFRVQLIIAAIVLVLCETIGIYYINHYLNVDPSKLTAAHIVFQFSIATFLINTITVPYNASIIANERMDIFALYSIFEVILKLGVAFLLPLFQENTLIYYAALMFGLVFIVQALYRWFCRRDFKECKLKNNANKQTIKEILSYSGWNLLGSFSGVATNQGVNMVLNSFFGVVVNAARGISFQVSAAMAQLYSNFQQALNPQIVKSYAAGDLPRMHFLITQGTRLAFFLLFVCALPIMSNIDGVLKLWLEDVPDYTAMFCILVITDSLINTMSQSLLMGAMATGNIRKYQIIVASINLLNVPLSIVGLLIYPDPYLTTYVMIGLSSIAFVARLILVHQMIDLSISDFLRRAIMPIVMSTAISILLVVVLGIVLPSNESVGRMFIRLAIMFVLCLGTVAVFGMTKQERQLVINYVKAKVFKR